MSWRRAFQVGGLMAAILSLASYYIVEAKPEKHSLATPNWYTPSGDVPTFNMIIAGRDISYCTPGFGPSGLEAIPCEGAERYNGRTDSMLLVRVQPGRMDVISIPRDTLVNDKFGYHKMNASFSHGGDAAMLEAGFTSLKDPGSEESYLQGGVAQLKASAESLLGVGIDYYVLFNVELVQKVIDALGGVDVNLPEAMNYTDRAANLYIDIPAGNSHLNGKKTVEYLRFRKGVGNDYARMDRQKAVIGQLLSKIKSPAAFGLLPTLISGLQNDVVTNVTPDLVQKMLASARGLTPHFDTLPTTENNVLGQQIIAGSYLVPNDAEIKAKLETVFTQAPTSSDLVLPTSAPTVVNQSGIAGLGEAMANYLERKGWLSANVITLEPASTPTQIMRRSWGDANSAEFYAKVLGVSVSTPYRYPEGANNIVVFLGKDAGSKYAALALEAKILAPKP